jgi:hypothetical protein
VTATSKGTVKPGVHRVKASDKSRITAWHETCTIDQIPKRGLHHNELEIRKLLEEIETGISMSKSMTMNLEDYAKPLGLTKTDMKQEHTFTLCTLI